MARLNIDQRNQIIGMITDGSHVTYVSRLFNCARATINRLITRFNATGSVKDGPWSDHLRVTTPREDRFITLSHLRRRFL